MSEAAIKKAVQARLNAAEYSFLSNDDYAAEIQRISDWQDAMYRANRIFVPTR